MGGLHGKVKCLTKRSARSPSRDATASLPVLFFLVEITADSFLVPSVFPFLPFLLGKEGEIVVVPSSLCRRFMKEGWVVASLPLRICPQSAAPGALLHLASW